MNELYWLGDGSKHDDYSRISTCLALSQSVYASDGEACVATLNELKYSMQHGISQVLFSVNCKRQYIIAMKERTKEIYVAFRGTESWKALLISFRVYACPNDFQGTLHSGYYQQAKLIPLAPFFYLLNKYKDYKLIFTGHSLGGAIATIVTLNMLADLRSIEFKEQIYCVAFGAPFIGNQACSNYVDQRYQKNFQFYINHHDIIPYLLTFIYNQTSNLLSQTISEKCNEWLKTLALSLVADGSPPGVFSRWARRFRLKRWSTQAECENELLGLSKYIFETCRTVLKQVLPDYHPFGLYFRTQCTSINATTETTFTIVPLSLKDVFKNDIRLDGDIPCSIQDHFIKNDIRLDGDIVCSIQDHFIKNYINEIYVNVIAKKEMVPRMDCPDVSLIQSFSSSSPLSLFLPSEMASWKWNDPSEKYENENLSYRWSVVVSKYDDKEEITLRIYGSGVSLITGLKCENSVYAEQALAPIENDDESVRLFILYLPSKKNRHANNYPFYVISHFNTVNLTGLFNPKKFTASHGMQGRKQQIADLTVLDLYKLAYAYCTFAEDEMTDDTSVDVIRRKEIEEYLLSSEKILEKDCHILEQEYLNRLTEEQLEELMKQISCIDDHSENLQESSPSSPCSSDDEYDGIRKGFDGLSSSKETEKDINLSKEVKFSNISSAMNNWRSNASARRAYQSQTIQTSDSSSNVLSTTESVVQVIPRLFTMNIALTQDFALKFNVRDISWKQIGIATIRGFILGFVGGVLCLSTSIDALIVSASSGIVFGGVKILYECLKSVQIEYLKILVLVAKSLGVIMDQVRMHQYCLEEKISSIYHDRLKESPKENIFAQWKNIFPGGVLNKLDNRDNQDYCLSIMKCIYANFQMRKLLSKDFALGVIGPGKSGKSTLLQNMFGFDTKPDKEIRTLDLRSYRVNEDFRVVDFPHMTSVFDYVKNCFTCNHTLVNAIIVVLNAEQGGNDSKGEKYVVDEVKKLTKKGVNVLFCFNQCDKLALKKGTQQVQRHIDKFTLYKTGNIQQPNASTENDQYEHWTKEHVENRRRQWAKNYRIDLDKCWMTFCDLEEIDENKCQENYKKLESVKLQSYLDIKEIWLKEVLKENCLSEESISEIMSFRCQENQ